MNRRPWICLVLVVLLLLAATASFAACQNQEPPALELHVEGDAYRGAVLPMHAVVRDEELASAVEFAIVEGDAYCYFYQEQLQIRNDTPIGVTIVVECRAKEYVCTASLVVGHTPLRALELPASCQAKAGDVVPIEATFFPFYADDNDYELSVVKGSEVASIVDGALVLANTADVADEVQVVATSGDTQSNPMTVQITTVQPKSLQVTLPEEMEHGDSVEVVAQVLPANCSVSVNCTLVRSDFADAYVEFDGRTLRIKPTNYDGQYDVPPEGQFQVQITAGYLTRTETVRVVKTPVTSVSFVLTRIDDESFEDDDGKEIHYVYNGEVLYTACRVYPIGATYRKPTYTVRVGAECVEAMEPDGTYRISTDKVGETIVIRAEADGHYSELSLLTKSRAPESLRLTCDGPLSVGVGEERVVSCTLEPQDAEGVVDYELVRGTHLATLTKSEGKATLHFIDSSIDNEVELRASVGDVSARLLFHVAAVPVTSVTLTTNDKCAELHNGDTVVLLSEVAPFNATHAQVQYVIEEGAEFGTLQGNVFTVGENAIPGKVKIVAVADLVQSEPLELEVFSDGATFAYTAWSQLDNDAHLFDNYVNVQLDLRELPYDANECVVVVSDSVEVLSIVGRYTGSLSTCFTNLYFYFLTTDSITVCLQDVGILIENGFTDTVLDFGGQASVTLLCEHDNYVQAGHAYAVCTEGYMIADDAENRLLRGMDGFAGNEGGTALCAYQVTLTGDGTLTMLGGNGSSGTDGTRGMDASGANTLAGNGGNGGNGGRGGYAIWTNTLVYDFTGSVELFAGHSGTGGTAGAAGNGVTTAYDGKVGLNGVHAAAHDAVCATEVVVRSGQAQTHWGTVQANTATRPWLKNAQGMVVSDAVALLSRHFKVNIYYADHWTNLHASSYNMQATTTVAERARLVNAFDYALQALGRNVLLDVQWPKPNQGEQPMHKPITLYFCKSMSTVGSLFSSSKVIYGLTDDHDEGENYGTNVWLAAFDSRKRDSLYSTCYNIAVHELLHVLYYNLPKKYADLLTNQVLYNNYNQGINYGGSGGVYNEGKNNGKTCAFLTEYSKTNNMEDISETLSLLCTAAQPATYTAADSSIVRKAQYISGVFAEAYAALDMWKEMKWLHFVY